MLMPNEAWIASIFRDTPGHVYSHLDGRCKKARQNVTDEDCQSMPVMQRGRLPVAKLHPHTRQSGSVAVDLRWGDSLAVCGYTE